MRRLLPVAIGMDLGLLGPVALSGLPQAYLWGGTGTDAEMLAMVAAGILSVAISGCWIPTREATGVDPVTALSL